MTKFVTRYGEKKQFPQSYEKDKIQITKAGKTYNAYQAIQEAKGDCNIYETLEKYGIVEPSFTDVEQFYQNKNNAKAFYGDFSEFEANMHPADFQAKAQEKWNNLPLAIRNAFGNSLEEFSKHGIEEISKIVKKTLANEIKKQEEIEIKKQEEIKGKNNEENKGAEK